MRPPDNQGCSCKTHQIHGKKHALNYSKEENICWKSVKLSRCPASLCLLRNLVVNRQKIRYKNIRTSYGLSFLYNLTREFIKLETISNQYSMFQLIAFSNVGLWDCFRMQDCEEFDFFSLDFFTKN